MQSKTSSFKLIDKALLTKNIKRTWPMWAGYAFCMLWLMPGILYFSNNFFMVSPETNFELNLTRTLLGDEMMFFPWISSFVGIFFAVVMFSYLQTEKSCNFYHSLPIARETLYSTGFISGYCMMLVPNIVMSVLSLIVCNGFGVNCIREVSICLLALSVEELFFYSFGCLCMIIIGNSVFAAVTYFIMIYLADIMCFPINGILSRLYYGISNDFVHIPDNFLGIISPVDFACRIDDVPVYEKEVLKKYVMSSGWGTIVLTMFIVSIIIIAVSVWFNHIRKSEHAGDFVAIDFMKPVFRWGFSICASLMLAWLIDETLFSYLTYTRTNIVIIVIMVMIFAFAGYVGAEMIIRKNFRIFDRIKMKLPIFMGVLLVSMTGLLIYGHYQAYRVPDPEEYQHSYVSIGESFYISDESGEARELHREILENYDELVGYRISKQYSQHYYIHFDYSDQKGNYIRRLYAIPDSDTELLNKIDAYAKKNAEELIFGDRDEMVLENVRMTATSNEGYGIQYIDIELDDAEKLKQAILKDIDEGNIKMYSVVSYYFNLADEEDSGEIEFEFKRVNDEYGFAYNYSRVNFNDNCKNVLNFIEEWGGIPDNFSYYQFYKQ